jgi:RNA 3'-terminal phosphate cyclase (ATP)
LRGLLSIDGSHHSGSGTIVRYSVAMATLLHQPVRVINVRQKRAQPGLRTQHVASVLACAELCGATTEGVHVDSREFTFVPGERIAGGAFEWNIGTAGSTTMLALSVLPVACFAEAPVCARIEGGVFQDFAPSPHHLQHVLASLLRRMGAEIDLQVERPGYVPGGAGVIQLKVAPSSRGLTGITLPDAVRLDAVRGVALASLLAGRRVSERMAAACESILEQAGVACDIERVLDSEARHAGANLSIWGESTTGCRFGADRAGKRGRTSEAIGEFVAQTFLADIRSGATVDRHIADQLVLFAALARGRTAYIVPEVSDHVLSNAWLVGQFGATVSIEGNRVTVDGVAFRRPA